MEIKQVSTAKITPYEKNAKLHPPEQVEWIANSIREFGFKQPLVLDKDNVIVIGHGRLLAAKKLGMKTVPCVYANDLNEEQIKALRLADNKTNESLWDFDLLTSELDEIALIDMSDFGFEFEEDINWVDMDGVKGRITEDFIEPPFSILDTTSQRWQDRKNKWFAEGLYNHKGREDDLLGLNPLVKISGNKKVSGTSKFDPVLCELLYTWFNIDDGFVFDPFAGGAVRGCVASKLGYEYLGIDLSETQIEINKDTAEKLDLSPVWVCDDSANADNYIEDESADMIFTCPPYADLEVYSDDPRDISNMPYDEFRDKYCEIMTTAVRKLKPNRFAVVVIGEVRGKDGFYYHLVSDTERIMEEAGARYYNEMILVESIGTLPFRIRQYFNSGRKIGKRHQNVLCFFKGNTKTIKDNYKQIEVPEDIEKGDDINGN